ncbi:uncharacterized protein STEHIDRAFT_91980 [Stereum hirsutum FP-91666 SS1]|uniref:uncharacterized protein n=1 Tax=Stereum hirsutum (strain FP-91666) TaxID=721885 RepID=UPI00044100E2|nr:uncharacterized protein STEHIDRAFT_91980 [Stereum hirsutum FP-91666 SS1]EIM89584.1 hypothetical protein STEHIDRAFT_91980 [Stereum hirsutum FP-91666 SS1]
MTTTASRSPSSLLQLPKPLARFFALFPLIEHAPQPVPSKRRISGPTLWIHPPKTSNDLLSADVECLKWQAHIALRGLTDVQVRSDVKAEGALGGRLPNLQTPSVLTADEDGDGDGDVDGEILPAHNIAAWIDERVGLVEGDELEGYSSVETKDESHAWVALLEGDVHAALALAQPSPSFFYTTILQLPASGSPRPVETLLTPPPAPLTGLSSLLPPYGARIPVNAVKMRYHDAVASLSERLGTDRWFLGSSSPTALDALAFAYLHTLLHTHDDLRIEVAKRVNLVTWERRVYEAVRGAFVPC